MINLNDVYNPQYSAVTGRRPSVSYSDIILAELPSHIQEGAVAAQQKVEQERFAEQMAQDKKQLQEMTRQFNEELAQTKEQFDAQLSASAQQHNEALSAQKAQFDADMAQQRAEFETRLGADATMHGEKLEQARAQFDAQMARQQELFDAQMAETTRQFNEKIAQDQTLYEGELQQRQELFDKEMQSERERFEATYEQSAEQFDTEIAMQEEQQDIVEDQAKTANAISLASLGVSGVAAAPGVIDLFAGEGAKEAAAAASTVAEGSPPSLSSVTAAAAPTAAALPATQSIGSLAELAGGTPAYHAMLGDASFNAAAGEATVAAGAEGAGFFAGLAPVAPIGLGILAGFAAADLMGFGGKEDVTWMEASPERKYSILEAQYKNQGDDFWENWAAPIHTYQAKGQWSPELQNIWTQDVSKITGLPDTDVEERLMSQPQLQPGYYSSENVLKRAAEASRKERLEEQAEKNAGTWVSPR